MFDKKLNSLKLDAYQIESAFSLVGGTQPTNHASVRVSDRRHVRFTKILPKKSKTIGAENDQESMLYNLDP